MPAGLGLRYAFLGALETSYLNANGKFIAWGTGFKRECGHAMMTKTVYQRKLDKPPILSLLQPVNKFNKTGPLVYFPLLML